MDTDLIENLNTRYLELTDEIAPIHAIYGPGGSWGGRRDILQAELFERYRKELSSDAASPRNTEIERKAKLDPDWEVALSAAETQRANLYRLYAERKTVSWQIEALIRATTRSESGGDFDDTED